MTLNVSDCKDSDNEEKSKKFCNSKGTSTLTIKRSSLNMRITSWWEKSEDST